LIGLFIMGAGLTPLSSDSSVLKFVLIVPFVILGFFVFLNGFRSRRVPE